MDTTDRLPAVQLTRCPECGACAEIVRRVVLESTEGPIEHAQVRCVSRHWFLLPVSYLDPPVQVAPAPRLGVRH